MLTDITEIRHALELSQREFSELLEVSPWAVKAWDRGLRNCPPSVIKLGNMLLEQKKAKKPR